MRLRIKELALEKGVQLQKVAKAIGVKESTLSNMIRTGRTTTERLDALCGYFNVTLDELVNNNNERGFLRKRKEDISLDIQTLFNDISKLPSTKQQPLIEAVQKMVDAVANA